MRAVRFHEYGGRDVLQLEEVDRPEPDHGEVLVEVAAAAVNPVDTYFRGGAYALPELPWIPGLDVGGTVAAVGAGVEEYDVGDPVFGTGLNPTHPGACAEYAAVPTDRLAQRPDALSAAEGAALALVGVTAWQALIETPAPQPGDVALIHGGSGGVGHIAVQLGTTAGLDVTTTASPAYHETLRAMGAHTVLDYGRDDLAEAVVDAGRPDAILDHRFDEYAGVDCEVAAEGADVVTIGNEATAATIEDVSDWRGKALANHHVSMFNTPDIGAVLDRLGSLAERGDVSPEIARRYGLDEVGEAHRAVLEDSYLGKLVVDVA